MLRLVSDYLPDVIDPPRMPGAYPGIQLEWDNPPNVQPGVLIDPTAKYSIGSGALGVEYSATHPDLIGRLTIIDLGLPIDTVLVVSVGDRQFSPVREDDPIHTAPNTYWKYDRLLFLHSEVPLTGLTVGIEAIILETSEYVDSSYNTRIDVPTNLTIIYAMSNGLKFSPTTTENPQTADLKRLEGGTAVRLYGSNIYNPESVQTVYVRVVADIECPAPDLAIAQFDLEDSIEAIDDVDLFGQVFIPSQFVFKPKEGDFFWNNQMLTVFTSEAIIAGIQTVQKSDPTYQSKLGLFSYLGVV